MLPYGIGHSQFRTLFPCFRKFIHLLSSDLTALLNSCDDDGNIDNNNDDNIKHNNININNNYNKNNNINNNDDNNDDNNNDDTVNFGLCFFCEICSGFPSDKLLKIYDILFDDRWQRMQVPGQGCL